MSALLQWGSLLLSIALAFSGIWFAWTVPASPAAATDPRTLLTGAAFFFGAFAFMKNAQDRLDQARQQHTLKPVFDTRLSSEFRKHLENRKLYFREGQAVTAEEFWSLLEPAESIEMSGEEAKRRRSCAESIRALLNYYEFVALGVHRRDLDHDMLKGSLRTIMCSLVVDMFAIIENYRAQNPRIYQNLVRLYMSWKDPEQPSFAVVHASPITAVRQALAEKVAPTDPYRIAARPRAEREIDR